MKITTLHTFETGYPADSIEWCPNENYRSYFVCGTYNLVKDSDESQTSVNNQRNGTIILLKFSKLTREFKEIYRLETAAILDMKWLPLNKTHTDSLYENVPVLAAANALGRIEIYTLEAERLQFRASVELNLENPKVLALSLDWKLPNSSMDSELNANSRHIAASDSLGNISVLEYTIDEVLGHSLKRLKTWNAHGFEAWICAFDKWNSNLIYTGGDDILMHAYDLRSYERVLTNRSHTAGVTCFLSYSVKEHLLLTGSYDEHVRIFDTRSMRRPVNELNVEGGVWRLKPDPYTGENILVACMYKNFSIINLSKFESGEDSLRLSGVYNEHESICYGADWCQDVSDEDREKNCLFMGTCSFYDKKLCLSHVELEK